MVDRTLVLRKLAELELYHQQIGPYSDTTELEYHEDWKTQRIVERTLQIMIETCLDVAAHIIADEKFRLPDYEINAANIFGFITKMHTTSTETRAAFHPELVEG